VPNLAVVKLMDVVGYYGVAVPAPARPFSSFSFRFSPLVRH
jgi:hypothetical protein